MKSVLLVSYAFIFLQQFNLGLGFFGGNIFGIPGIPDLNGRGQLGDCYLLPTVCNANAIKITEVTPYNQPILSAVVAPLILADPTLNTKNCDALCRCLTSQGGSCQPSIPFINSNGCPIFRQKCRCDGAYGAIQQAQAAARLFTGRVCV